MGKSPLIIALLPVAVLLAGCASRPGPTGAAGGPANAPAATQPSGGQHFTPQGAPGPSMPAPPVPGNDAQAAAMQEVMSELQQIGTLDPATRDRIMADMQRTDPALWPALMHQFRATAAYRNRTQGRPADAGPMQAASAPGQFQPAGDPALTANRTNQLMPGSVAANVAQPAAAEQPATVNRLPVANSRMEPPRNTPSGNYPRTPAAELVPRRETQQMAANSGGVVKTSYEASGEGAWRSELQEAIRSLESQVVATPRTPDEIAQHARLRVLYMLADRRDEAVRPIPEVPPAMQDFWSKQVFGMSTWLDTNKTADSTKRAAETKWILDEAVKRLGESAPLVVRNLAFCTAVQSYGSTTEFKKYEFEPNQTVLLYAEVENFTSVSTEKGYHTSLKSSYQILDANGRRVESHDFTTNTEDHCDNSRRDFFIYYQLRLPERIYPGKHTLQLTIEDLKSKKIGQSSIDFTVKGK